MISRGFTFEQTLVFLQFPLGFASLTQEMVKTATNPLVKFGLLPSQMK